MKIERRIWNRRKSTTISDNDKIQQNILRQLKEIEEMKNNMRDKKEIECICSNNQDFWNNKLIKQNFFELIHQLMVSFLVKKKSNYLF